MSQSEMFPLEAEETLIDSAEATVSPEGEVTPEDITEPEPADELHALLGTTPAKRVVAEPEVEVELEVEVEPEVHPQGGHALSRLWFEFDLTYHTREDRI